MSTELQNREETVEALTQLAMEKYDLGVKIGMQAAIVLVEGMIAKLDEQAPFTGPGQPVAYTIVRRVVTDVISELKANMPKLPD